MWVTLIVIFVLLMHGLGHFMGMMPGWTKGQTTLTGTPWLIPFESSLAKFWGFMWFGVVILFIVALVGMFFKTSWWPMWLIIASVSSLVVIAPWWNTMPFASKIGAVGVDIIVLTALLGPMREQVIKWLS